MRVLTAQANRLGNREMNQDRMTVLENDNSILLVIADGMGGHAGGEIAAEIVINTMTKHFQSTAKPIRNPRAFLGLAIEAAHSNIVSIASSRQSPFDPRTTCVACLVQGQHAWWAHVGDSRLYLLREQQSILRTEDHSYVQDLHSKGEISEADMLTHPMRNYLTNCLGGDAEQPTIAFGEYDKLQTDDVLVLCTDGFWSQLVQGQLESLCSVTDIDSRLNELADLAEQRYYPQSDNVSAVALRWLSLGNEPDLPVPSTKIRKPDNQDKTEDPSISDAIDAINRALEQYRNEMEP